MKKSVILILCFLAAGCNMNTPDSGFSSDRWGGPSIELTNIDQVRPGMTYGEVMGIMGDKINIGYQQSNVSGGVFESIPIPNPYGEEILDGGIYEYRVVYYFTHIKKADGIVTEDELTPLVFEENRLVGKGKRFLDDLKKKLSY